MNSPASISTNRAIPPGGASNPLLQPWTGPFGGVPPLAGVQTADFGPALEAAMAMNLREIDAIAQNSAAPTFENTLLELERAGQTFNRVMAVYEIWSSTMSTDAFQAVEREMGPKIAAFRDRITQNAALFARIQAVYEAPAAARSGPQQRLCWHYYTTFVRAGARLEPAVKRRVAAINERLAALFANFSQNLLADEAAYVLYIQDSAQLDGLPEAQCAAAAAAATALGFPGQWAILNTRSSMEPFLTYAKRRELREIVWRTYYNRGDNGGAHDNKAIITEILGLRAERARCLGFATHAHWRLEDSMAKTPESAMALLMQVWPAAVAREQAEVADMQALANQQAQIDGGPGHAADPGLNGGAGRDGVPGAGLTIEAWDYRFYAEQVRKAQHDLDMSEVKSYLQLEKLREGMFWVAGELYGFTFVEVTGLPVPHPDVRVWEVRGAAGNHVGLWYFDPYARPGKSSGAWMSEYRDQHRLDAVVSPIVSNNTNFVKGSEHDPVLISWDDAVTLFHEFGHALHTLNSNVEFPSLSGTRVVRDFVEFPSQLTENWLPTPEVLSRFALHYATGEAIPQKLVEKLKLARTFNQGFGTVEYLSAALVDMALHLAVDERIDPAEFERRTLGAIGMPREVVMRHRTPQFAHIFASDGYSAGYYSYLWAEVLDHDAFEAFTAGAGPYDKAVAKRLQDDIMAIGNTVDPGLAYRRFRGSDPKIDALLRARGFAVTP